MFNPIFPVRRQAGLQAPPRNLSHPPRGKQQRRKTCDLDEGRMLLTLGIHVLYQPDTGIGGLPNIGRPEGIQPGLDLTFPRVSSNWSRSSGESGMDDRSIVVGSPVDASFSRACRISCRSGNALPVVRPIGLATLTSIASKPDTSELRNRIQALPYWRHNSLRAGFFN